MKIGVIIRVFNHILKSQRRVSVCCAGCMTALPNVGFCCVYLSTQPTQRWPLGRAMGAGECVCLDAHTHLQIFPPPTHTHTHTHTTTTHQAQHLAAISKNITLEKRWKNTSLVWWRRRERERWRSNGPKPLSHLLIFYRTLTTERQVCSAVFAVQPPPPNAFT